MSQSTLQQVPGTRVPRGRLYSWTSATLGAPGRWLNALDRILRGEATRPSALQRQSIDVPVAGLTLTILVLALFYGVCMGMFPGMREEDPSPRLWLACTLKIPALFFFTFFVTFPSLYVLNALVGSRLRFAALVKLLVAALGVNLAVLASVGPIVAFFSFGTQSAPFMLLLNVLMFAVSGFLGMIFLLQTLHRLSAIKTLSPEMVLPREPMQTEPSHILSQQAGPVQAGPVQPGPVQADSVQADLVQAEIEPFNKDFPDPSSGDAMRNAAQRVAAIIAAKDEPSALDQLEGHVLGRHVKTVFYCWTVIFSVVGAQMAWVLRPYFGDPHDPFVWFGPRTSNFFEGVWHIIRQLMS